MTPEEKAKDLVEKFCEPIYREMEWHLVAAKDAAIICVNEILLNNFWEDTKSQANYIEYWHNVLTALNNQNT